MYKKSGSWYISQELKKITRKIQNKINSKGSPKVKVYSKTEKETAQLGIEAPFYAKFQDKGVAGTQSGRSINNYRFKNKMPPSSAFSRYTSDKREQFLIARSVYKNGIPMKKYIDETIGHYAPQIQKAIDKGMIKYIDSNIEKALHNGTSI